MAPNDDDRVCTFSGNLRGLQLFHRPRHQIKPTKTVCCQSPVARTMADHSIHAEEQQQNFCCQNCSGTMHILLDANQSRQQPLLDTRTQLNSGIHYHSRALHHIQPASSVSATLAALLVQSHLDYANSLLYGTLAVFLHKLQCSQNSLLANVNSLYAIACPFVCRLSLVCNIRAPYSGSFRQYFYGIRYLGHRLTSTENFTEIVVGEPLHRGS